MVLSRGLAGGNAMLLILQPGERFWRVAYENVAAHTDVPDAMLRELLDGVRRPRAGETPPRCWGWTLTREDFPLNAFIRSELPVRFSVKIMEHFYGMRSVPGQCIRPQLAALRELSELCDDLPEVRARFAIERVAARCDPLLRDLVKEDSGVRVREYNFAVAAQAPDSRVNRFRWARSFPALWGLRTEPHLRELIDAGRPFIKPAAALLDCSPAEIRRLRVMQHSAVVSRNLQELHGYVRGDHLGDQQPAARFEDRPPSAGVLDVPLLLLDGLAGLPADKLPPLESLTSCGVAIAGGPSGDASVASVICDSFYAARLLVEESPGAINPIFPAFRPLLASTGGDWISVGRQIENLTREYLIGIRDFVRMLANALVLPYSLRVHEDRDQADVQETLQSTARRQTALMLAARWHIGTFLRRSAEWHKLLGIAAGVGGNGSSGDHAWPAWFERFETANGVVIQPLCSSWALQEEGVFMHHCVGGYDRECMSGRTQIFSLRTVRGRRLSTLQLFAREIRPGIFHFTEGQNLAFCNGPPPGTAVTAAEQLLVALNGGDLQHYLGGAPRRRAAADVKTLCGFDYRSDTAWEQVRAGAIQFLPSDLQRLSPMELGATVMAFRPKQRSEQPELSEPDDDHEDFEKRVLRWIR